MPSFRVFPEEESNILSKSQYLQTDYMAVSQEIVKLLTRATEALQNI